MAFPSEQRLVRRAQILLKAHGGFNKEQIAQALRIDRETVQRWRQRWSEAESRLGSRRGSADYSSTPQTTNPLNSHRSPSLWYSPTFTAQQVVGIVALACEDPQEAGVPVTEWTPRELAQKASERGIVETISARTVERFLCMRLNFNLTVIGIG